MSKLNLLGYNIDDLSRLMVSLGEKPFKGKQLFKWLYKFQQYDFDLMTDLRKEIRDRLSESYTFEGLKPTHISQSTDGTEKFLFRLHDGHPVEAVMIPEEDRRTVCLSSQAGCALKCRFCATGTLGLLRDLTVGEIVGQIVFIREKFGLQGFRNIVLMGMGEPLLNFDNVVEAIRILSNDQGMNISTKRITVSTCGITPKIIQLADSDIKPFLAISLHAAIQEKRERIMPVARSFPLEELIEAGRYYARKTKTRITIEYIVFRGYNDTVEDIRALSKLLRGLPCKINILAYNPVSGLDFDRPSEEEIDSFGRQLYPHLPAVTVRRSRGLDIEAACGQLAAQNVSGGSSNE